MVRNADFEKANRVHEMVACPHARSGSPLCSTLPPFTLKVNAFASACTAHASEKWQRTCSNIKGKGDGTHCQRMSNNVCCFVSSSQLTPKSYCRLAGGTSGERAAGCGCEPAAAEERGGPQMGLPPHGAAGVPARSRQLPPAARGLGHRSGAGALAGGGPGNTLH